MRCLAVREAPMRVQITPGPHVRHCLMDAHGWPRDLEQTIGTDHERVLF